MLTLKTEVIASVFDTIYKVKLILIRHGETQENIDGIVQGWLNTTLNDNGRRQALIASRKFTDDIDAIYSSDLKRCLETSEYFLDKYENVPFHKDSKLRERNFGDAQGTHKDSQDWEVFWASKYKVSIPNAENLNDYTKRVNDFLEQLKASHQDYERILIITHGGTINRILDILKINENYQAIKNCESITVDLILE